jgi:hypothetical protein
MNKKTKAIAAAALAGMIASVHAPKAFAEHEGHEHGKAAEGEKHSCKGEKMATPAAHGEHAHDKHTGDKDSCKGKEGCHGADKAHDAKAKEEHKDHH